jgi:hypothetical protein
MAKEMKQFTRDEVAKVCEAVQRHSRTSMLSKVFSAL